MKTYLLTILSFLCFTGMNAQEKPISYRAGEIIVMIKENDQLQKLLVQNQKIGSLTTDLAVKTCLSKSMHIWLLEFNSQTNAEIMLTTLRRNSLIVGAQFNHYTTSRTTTPNDASFATQWGMNNTGQSGGTIDADVDAPEAWDIATGGLTSTGDTIVVAVLDGGFQLSHPDLKFRKNYNEIPSNGIDDDANGYIDDYNGWNAIAQNGNVGNDTHGTHVAGIVGAKGNNSIGVSGVNWNVQVLPIVGATSLESEAVIGYGYVLDCRRLYRTSNGAQGAFIVSTNASFGVDLGQPANFPLWCAIYDSLGSEGVLSAGATANQNWDIDAVGDIPTACASPWMVSVTNTTRTDARNSGAAYGLTTIDLGAPGTSVLSTYPTSTYNSLTGTSMATPHVAGAIALMYAAACPQLINDYKMYPDSISSIMKDYLLQGTDGITALATNTVSGGRLNLYNSLLLVQQYVCAISSIEALQQEENFIIKNIFPNPTTNFFELEYTSSAKIFDVVITNSLGEKVKVISRTNHEGINRHKVNIEDLSAGIYFVNIVSLNNASKVMKVIKL